MISSVSPTQSSTAYTYLVTKIGNRNLKEGFLFSCFFHYAYVLSIINKPELK